MLVQKHNLLYLFMLIYIYIFEKEEKEAMENDMKFQWYIL